MKKPTIKSITLDYSDVEARAKEKFADVLSLDYLEKPKITFTVFLKSNGKTTKHSIVLSASYVTGLYAYPSLLDYDNLTVKTPEGKVTTDGHLIKAQLVELMQAANQSLLSGK